VSSNGNKKVVLSALARIALIAGLLVVALLPTSQAHAYGRAVYQIETSVNCNNPALCGSSLGGFWAWGAFFADGTFDATITGCSHAMSGVPAGAQHLQADGHWTIQNGMIVITQETDTFTGTLQGTVVENTDVPFVVAPAKPGHYSTQDILGFPTMPGVVAQLQVVLVPSN
jgi:hypothetical protein